MKIIITSLILTLCFIDCSAPPKNEISKQDITKYAEEGNYEKLISFLSESYSNYDTQSVENKSLVVYAIDQIEGRKLLKGMQYVHEIYFNSPLTLQSEILNSMNIYNDTFPSYGQFMQDVMEKLNTGTIDTQSMKLLNRYGVKRSINTILEKGVEYIQIEDYASAITLIKYASDCLLQTDSILPGLKLTLDNQLQQLKIYLETQNEVTNSEERLNEFKNSGCLRKTFIVQRRFGEYDSEFAFYQAADASTGQRIVLMAKPSQIPNDTYKRWRINLIVEDLGENKYILENGYSNEYYLTYRTISGWDDIDTIETNIKYYKQLYENAQSALITTNRDFIEELQYRFNLVKQNNIQSDDSVILSDNIQPPQDSRDPSEIEILSFIDGCTKDFMNRDVNKLMERYSDSVRYFSENTISKSKVREDVSRYFNEYNNIHLAVKPGILIKGLGRNYGWDVSYQVDYSVHSMKKNVTISGVSENKYIIIGDGDSLKIFKQTSKVLSRNTKSDEN